MARQVLPIVGAVAGFVITGGNPAGAQFGFAIGSLVGNAVDPIEMQGRKLGDSPTQVAAEGGARAIVYGKGCIRATCILERGGRRVIKQRDRSGGKGGGPTTINERALWTFAIGLGEPVAAILRIWENEKLVYDVTPTSTIPVDTAQFAEKFRFYAGAEDQLPDPALEALHGVGNTPYYRGTAYMVFPQYDLTDFGETVPTYRVEVAAVVEIVDLVADSAILYSLPAPAPPTQRGVLLSPDGTDWDAEGSNIPSSAVYILGGRSRYVTFFDTPYYSDDARNWVASTGEWLGSGGGAQGASRGDTWLIPGGILGINRSLDNATSFTGLDYPSAPRSNAIAMDGSGAMSISGYETYCSFASAPFETWENRGSPFGAEYPGFAPCLEVGEGTWAIGTGISGVPRLAASISAGAGWTEKTVPYDAAEEISHSRFANGVWVFGTDNGEVYFSDDGLATIQRAADDLGCRCEGLDHNGEVFIMTGRDPLVSGSGVVKTSPDGNVWTTRAVSFPFNPAGVASLEVVTEAAVGEPIPLSSVIAALHERCGHTSVDYDVSEATDMLAGVVVEQTVTAAEAINSIIGAHFIDPSDYDGKIHYIQRGKPVVLTLTEDDLIDEPDEAQRNNAIEYPKKVHFLGQRADLAYASSKSTSARYSDDAKVVGEITIGSPETYDDGIGPAEVAVKLHKVLWTEAEGEREWIIPDNYLKLVPTDNVGLSYRGELVRCRILNIEDTPGQRKLRMIRDRQSAYTANLTEIPNPPAPTPPQSSVIAPTIMAFIDSSALTDNADTLHYLVALSGANDNWAGAALQQQLSGDFTTIDSTTLNSIMGALQNTVTDASPYYTDTTNTLTVRLFTDDTLESRTDAEFLSNGGAFFLSSPNSGQTEWEIMQFRDAVQDSNGDWILSHLMRGRKNTPTSEHPPGSVFVWIDPAILRESAQSSWIGTILTHRAVSNGQSPELATIQNNEYVGNSQREWPVAELTLSRPTADSVLAEAIPRYRFGTSMNPIRSQNMEQFTWTATDGLNSETAQTPFNTPSYTFDTTGWGSPVTVTVAQWNRITGDGPTVSEEIV